MLNIDHVFPFSLGQGLVQKVHDAIKDNSLLEVRATFRHFDSCWPTKVKFYPTFHYL